MFNVIYEEPFWYVLYEGTIIAFIHKGGDAVYADPAYSSNSEFRATVLQKQYEILNNPPSVKKMSKFTFDVFDGEWDFAVSAQRYSRQQSIALFVGKYNVPVNNLITVAEKFVVHRAGVTPENRPRVTWWLVDAPEKNACPVWVFSLKAGNYRV